MGKILQELFWAGPERVGKKSEFKNGVWADCEPTKKVLTTEKRMEKWSMGVSIPLPADCEPTALPSELIPLHQESPSKKNIPVFVQERYFC